MKKVLLTLTLAAFAFAANAQFVVTGNASFNTNGGSTWNKDETSVTGVNNFESKVPQNIRNVIEFGPSIGYMLSDKMQVGLGFNITYDYRKTFYQTPAYEVPNLDAEDWNKVSRTNFTIAPYFRYYFMEAGNFNFFCQATAYWTINGRPHTHRYATKINADATYGVAARDAVDTTYVGTFVNPVGTMGEKVEVKKHTETDMTLGIRIVPGVSYKFNEKFSADLYFEMVSVQFSHNWQKEYLETGHTPAVGTAWTESHTDRTRNNTFTFGANFDDLSINQFLNFRLAFNYHF